MSTSTGKAKWSGTLKKGKGEMTFGNYTGPYTFASRFESGEGTNPEELIGAALAGCYSMFLSGLIGAEDLEPEMIETIAQVRLDKDDKGPLITSISLECHVKCSGLSESKFGELAKTSKEKCPVSRLYQGAEIKLNARLI
ncbi:MAG: OsmC family peroxiredoxin [Bacteroidales bacterium]|nr:OsmC family peroxiredoxin [Bacteroidales bacterium]